MVNQTMQLVKDDDAMESIIAKVMELQDQENTNIPLYEKQLRDAESGIQNMLNVQHLLFGVARPILMESLYFYNFLYGSFIYSMLIFMHTDR